MAKQVKILCVCGSGTVSSAMVANKLKEKLGEHGFNVSAVECRDRSGRRRFRPDGLR